LAPARQHRRRAAAHPRAVDRDSRPRGGRAAARVVDTRGRGHRGDRARDGEVHAVHRRAAERACARAFEGEIVRRLAFVVLVMAAGCSKCGKQAGTPAYVIVPSVEKLGAKLQLVEQLKVANFGAQAGGFDSATAYVDALVAEL